jgi:uncharacterized protein (TIGR03083 family)
VGVEPSDIYSASRSRLLELAADLSPEQLAASLPATPPWVLVDAYRHLTGVCADVLDGAMENAGTPQWTAAQIAKRCESSLVEVCAEWAERAPELDARVAQAGRAMSFVAFDTWTHEQDVRAAAGVGGARDEIAAELALIALETFRPRYAKSGAPALLIDIGEHQTVLGPGDGNVDGGETPPVTLTTTPYELLRMIFGRRSRRQMESVNWTGTRDDTTSAIDALHLFDMPPIDIHD